MRRITDAQVEVAENAFWAAYTVTLGPVESMRAALEAYERVRDLAAIYGKADAKTEQQERQL